jgi:hypothetical protein
MKLLNFLLLLGFFKVYFDLNVSFDLNVCLFDQVPTSHPQDHGGHVGHRTSFASGDNPINSVRIVINKFTSVTKLIYN